MSPTPQRPATVVIVGAGNVGATFAYALVGSGLAGEIILIDANERRAEGEAMDLAHAVPFGRPVHVRAGTYADCASAAVTVVTAGAAQRPGESRLDLVRRNDEILGDIVPRVADTGTDGVLLMTTNPVDVLTYRAVERSGLPPARVFGSGTILDTARFRSVLGAYAGVDPRSVHAFIVGEHGDSEVALWSGANIAGVPIADYCAATGLAFDDAVRDRLTEEVRRAAYEIIDRKGATYYAIASGLLRIVESILRDQRTVLTVSSLQAGAVHGADVAISLPTIVGTGGVEQVLDVAFSDAERAAFDGSAAVLRATILSLPTR